MSQELAKPQNDLRSFIAGEKFKEQVQLALPSHMTPDRFARIALTAINKTPKLLDCTRESVLSCMMTCSQLGLEPDGRLAHLIPYGKECSLIVDWKGMVALAKRSGQVKLWRAELVKENDEFSWETGQVRHHVNWRKDRGKTECVYSHVVTADGSSDFEVMTLAEVEAIRKRSKAGNSGPWVTDFDEMARKTVMRRHSKRLTLSPEFHDALDKDHDRYDDIRTVRNVTPAPPVPNILSAGPIVEEKKPGPAAQFWLWCESREFSPKDVYGWLIANNHVGSADDELSDAEAEKINRDELNADMS